MNIAEIKLTKWIPTSVEPKKDQACVIILGGLFALAEYKFLDEEVGCAFVAAGYDYEEDEETGFDQFEITHWFPIPNPPKQ